MSELIHEIAPADMKAWDTEYGDFVVWGTHNWSRARLEVRKYLLEVVGEEPEHLDGCTPPAEDFKNARKMWADPRCLEMEEIWPKDMIQPHSEDLVPYMGWVPYMVISQ
jgi:hypothetical protein